MYWKCRDGRNISVSRGERDIGHSKPWKHSVNAKVLKSIGQAWFIIGDWFITQVNQNTG